MQAIIVEVSVQHSRDIGVAAFAPQFGNGNMLGVGTLNFGALQNALGNPLGFTGLGIGLASGSNCTLPGTLAIAYSSDVRTSSSLIFPCFSNSAVSRTVISRSFSISWLL